MSMCKRVHVQAATVSMVPCPCASSNHSRCVCLDPPRIRLSSQKDKFSTLGSLVATGRLVVQLTRDGVEGSLGVQIGDEEVYIPIPAWTGLWADADILTKFFHRHGANGRCISIVFEVAEPQVALRHRVPSLDDP